MHGYLDLPDPDVPIYRILSLWQFEELFRLRQMVLVQPQAWDDPFELLAEMVVVYDMQSQPATVFSPDFLPPAFCQSWSRLHNSDPLLRAYSRVSKDPIFHRNTSLAEEGVQVRSTPRRILDALRSWSPKNPEVSCFVGAVRYLPRDDVLQVVAEAIGSRGPDAFRHPENRARLLLYKRDDFAHEAEVRLIHVGKARLKGDPIIRVPVDPNAVFDEITFDPRLAPFEQQERAALAHQLGYQGSIGRSDRYTRTLLEVYLNWNAKRSANAPEPPTPPDPTLS